MFKKKGTIVDIPLLEKRGIVKKIPRNKNLPKISEGYFDYSQTNNATQNSEQEKLNPLGFLDSLANSATTPLQTTKKSNSDLNDLKIKLDDLEYKIERFLERVAKLETKLEELERNINL